MPPNMLNKMSIRENIESIRKEIGDNVTLIAVSKTKPVSDIQEAYDCGQRDFGENKVQELTTKIPELPDDIRWHLIGHLQRNKVKYIIDKVYLIHSVDSLRLAEEIEHQASLKDITVNILLQVNISHEESKFGMDREEVFSLVREISAMPHIRIMGLMTIAPFTENPESVRPVFRELKNLSIDIKALNIDNVSTDILSMGMSGDYCVAIEEGSTMIRVGTGIFGERNYNI